MNLEFDKELHSLNDSKLPISASKIQSITKLALKHVKTFKTVVFSIEKFIQKCPPELKLAGIYVVDSIARTGKKSGGENLNYVTRFAEKLDGICVHLTNAPAKDFEKIKKLLIIWKTTGIFDEELISSIQATHFTKSSSQTEEMTVPAVPATYVPPEPVHVPPPPNLITPSASIQLAPPSLSIPTTLSLDSSLPPLSNLAPPPALAQLFGLSNPLNPIPSGPRDPNEFDYDDDDDGSNSRPNLNLNTSNMLSTSPITSSMNSFGFPPLTPSNPMDLSNALGSLLQQPQLLQGLSGLSNVFAPSSLPLSVPMTNHMTTTTPLPSQLPPQLHTSSHFMNQLSSTQSSLYSNSNNMSHGMSSNIPIPKANGISNAITLQRDESGYEACEIARYDPTVPSDCIRILSRTIYVGGVTSNMTQSDLTDLIQDIAQVPVESVIINYQKLSAFIKLPTRKNAERARETLKAFKAEGYQLRVGWALGYGPKDLFDNQTGWVDIPVDRMTEFDVRAIMEARRGGTKDLQPGHVMEEPEVDIKEFGHGGGVGRRDKAKNRDFDDFDDVEESKKRRFS